MEVCMNIFELPPLTLVFGKMVKFICYLYFLQALREEVTIWTLLM